MKSTAVFLFVWPVLCGRVVGRREPAVHAEGRGLSRQGRRHRGLHRPPGTAVPGRGVREEQLPAAEVQRRSGLPDLPQGDHLPAEARRVLRPASRQGRGEAAAFLRNRLRKPRRLAQRPGPPGRDQRSHSRRAHRPAEHLPGMGAAAEPVLCRPAAVLSRGELLPVLPAAIAGPLRRQPAAVARSA